MTLTLNYTSIKIAATYFPPRYNITTQQLKPFFTSLSYNFIIGGDLKAKHLE